MRNADIPEGTAFADAARRESVRRRREAFVVDEAVSSIRHDVLSNLTGIGNVAYLLRRRIEGGDAAAPDAASPAELLRMIRTQVATATEKLQRQLVEPRNASSPVSSFTATAARAIAGAYPLPGVSVALVTSDVADTSLAIAVDDVELEIALTEIVANAVEATASAGGGAVHVRGAPAPDDHVVVLVDDHGAGLSGDAASQALAPFYTTKPGRLGLGLTVARRIAQRWGGTLEFDAAPGGKGARVSLRLPRGEADGRRH